MQTKLIVFVTLSRHSYRLSRVTMSRNPVTACPAGTVLAGDITPRSLYNHISDRRRITGSLNGFRQTSSPNLNSPLEIPRRLCLSSPIAAVTMFPQRNIFRLSQRAGQQLRSAPVRSAVQRRFNSTETKPSWMVDNEFNRERAAVKEHAAGTSGTYLTG